MLVGRLEKNQRRFACDCGKRFVCDFRVILNRKGSFDGRACGCLVSREKRDRASLKGHPLYHVYMAWRHMLARCLNEKHISYPSFGGRDIRVCKRWRDSFDAFAADIGPRPSRRYVLQRIDQDGHFKPGNVQWLTRRQSAAVKRSNRFITFNGKTMHAAAWARYLGLSRNAMHHRLATMPLEVALAAPRWKLGRAA